ncbi:hypothetical protein HYALB_00013346 [Hymenoscyphus albidus]|uniref:Tyrosine specific protein phosphatases domain-containing protein n=1 Tax=Hymenoscyphus albidus TaxID=595503 RepID=A0A9N9M102_9HELO|nr:hypothetical protein HYALB_00013346 [Hymenoscyphus albidus]
MSEESEMEDNGPLTTEEDLRRAAEITSKPPFVQIGNLCNFRDVGGWDVDVDVDLVVGGEEGEVGDEGDGIETDGRRRVKGKVRKGILYRGPDLYISPFPFLSLIILDPTQRTNSHPNKSGSLTTQGEQTLRDELHVKTILDLRSVPQIERAGGVREVEGTRRVWCPVFEVAMYSPVNAGRRYGLYCGVGEGIVAAFEEIMEHSAKPSFIPLLHHLASLNPTQPDATILHCTTGNNRTGILTALLLSLLGVPDSQIVDEYALSHHGLASSREKTVDRLMRNQRFVEVIGEGVEGRKKAARMVGARRESMGLFLQRVRERGGVEGWARGLGVSGECVEGVRGVMVEVFEEEGG